MEIWRDCKGYEGKYQVSNQGRVWSITSQRYLSGSLDKDGYRQVYLTAKNGKARKEFVHRLAAIAFIENNEKLPQVNHKDEDKLNNNVSNLEWVTAKANSNYGTRNKRVADALSKNIYCIELNKIFKGARDAEKELGISHSCISRACRGEQLTAGGYHWEFVGGDANAND